MSPIAPNQGSFAVKPEPTGHEKNVTGRFVILQNVKRRTMVFVHITDSSNLPQEQVYTIIGSTGKAMSIKLSRMGMVYNGMLYTELPVYSMDQHFQLRRIT
jgi:hypothetical protein